MTIWSSFFFPTNITMFLRLLSFADSPIGAVVEMDLDIHEFVGLLNTDHILGELTLMSNPLLFTEIAIFVGDHNVFGNEPLERGSRDEVVVIVNGLCKFEIVERLHNVFFFYEYIYQKSSDYLVYGREKIK